MNPYEFTDVEDRRAVVPKRKALVYYTISSFVNFAFLQAFLLSEFTNVVDTSDIARDVFMASMATFVIHSGVVVFASAVCAESEQRIEDNEFHNAFSEASYLKQEDTETPTRKGM